MLAADSGTVMQEWMNFIRRAMLKIRREKYTLYFGATKSCSSTAMLSLLFVLMCFRSRASFAVTVPDTQPSNNATQMGRGSFGSALSNPRCVNLLSKHLVCYYYVFYITLTHNI